MSRVRVVIGLGVVLLFAVLSACSQQAVRPEDRPPGGFVDVGRTGEPDLELERLVAEERFPEALSLALSRADERLADAGPNDLSTLRALRRVGVVAGARFAASIYDAILPVLRRAGPAARSEPVETLIQRGYVARRQGDRAMATALYDEAGKALHDGPHDARLESALEKAVADWTRGIDRTRAIRLYEDVLRIRKDSPDVPWFSIAETETI